MLDLGGNVREWVTQGAGLMARGGDWRISSVNGRAAYRTAPHDVRSDYVGVRVCASVPRARRSF